MTEYFKQTSEQASKTANKQGSKQHIYASQPELTQSLHARVPVDTRGVRDSGSRKVQ